jgi:hypothetical protein
VVGEERGIGYWVLGAEERLVGSLVPYGGDVVRATARCGSGKLGRLTEGLAKQEDAQ